MEHCAACEQEFSNILGALYLAMLFLGIINAMSVQPVVEMERTVGSPIYWHVTVCACTLAPCGTHMHSTHCLQM